MKKLIALLLLCATARAFAFDPPVAATPAAPDSNRTPSAPADDPDQRLVEQAAERIHAGAPAEAIPLLDAVIARQQAQHKDEKRLIYCARSLVETILYATMGAEAKKDTVVLGPTWATAVFLKGFALIDLGSSDAGKPLLEGAVALSPMNAQFVAELGEWYKNHKDWAAAYASFERASSAAEFSPDPVKSAEKRRALRGMGFALTEQGHLDEAEKLYRECLKIESNDTNARQELDYIQAQRARKKNTAS